MESCVLLVPVYDVLHKGRIPNILRQCFTATAAGRRKRHPTKLMIQLLCVGNAVSVDGKLSLVRGWPIRRHTATRNTQHHNERPSLECSLPQRRLVIKKPRQASHLFTLPNAQQLCDIANKDILLPFLVLVLHGNHNNSFPNRYTVQRAWRAWGVGQLPNVRKSWEEEF